MAIWASPDKDLQAAPVEESGAIAPDREELAVLNDPHGRVAEQFRGLRNSLQALNPDGAARSVLMASAVRGEGRTVATLNLALALAELPRMRVLVLDGDLHHPALEAYLDLPRRQGLTELLRGDLDLDRAVRSTSVDGLSVMGAGARPANASELLGSDRIKSVLQSVKQRFDYVLVDSPPALVVNDASLLGSIVDGIVLVVRLGSTPRHQTEQTQTLLENLGGNVLGTCLTGAVE